MLLVVSSGSEYTAQPMASFNFVESYLRAIFGFVGLTDVHVFHAHGMDMGPELKKSGQRSAIAHARAFAQSGAWRPARPVAPGALELLPQQPIAPAQVLVA